MEQVGREWKTFFEAGGHSLLLARMVGELRDQVDPGLTVVAMFEFPTIASLAQHLRPTAEAPPAGNREPGSAKDSNG